MIFISNTPAIFKCHPFGVAFPTLSPTNDGLILCFAADRLHIRLYYHVNLIFFCAQYLIVSLDNAHYKNLVLFISMSSWSTRSVIMLALNPI